MANKPTLDSLFPTPSLPPSPISPARWAGVTPQTVQVLKRVLKDNHEKWHIFHNDRGFHNHAGHRSLALWTVGADGALIEAGYEADTSYLRKTYPSPNAITQENFQDHFGDPKYWSAYLEFFSRETLDLGLPGVLEKYIFSREFNIGGGKDGEESPRMLDRFFSGLLHPFIHTAHGYEFGLPGIIAEGLALTALTKPSDVITGDFFTKYARAGDGATVAGATPQPKQTTTRTHALTIIARLIKDDRTSDANKELLSTQGDVTIISKYGDVIREYLEQWDNTETADPVNVTRKFEELVWTNVAIYGASELGKDGEFKNDFLFMHLVTSALFLPSLLPSLSPPSQDLLLLAYFAATIATFIIRGRPNLNIKALYKSQETAYPIPGGILPTPHEKTLPLPSADANRIKAVTPNPWLPIIETSITHPNEHLIKLQRALAHFSTLFGHREQGAREGGLEGAAQELEGAELLDGTLFVRVAGLTATKMGRVREGEAVGQWNSSGFQP